MYSGVGVLRNTIFEDRHFKHRFEQSESCLTVTGENVQK